MQFGCYFFGRDGEAMGKKGFTLIEVLIASVLIAIAVAGGLASFEVAHRGVERAKLENIAIVENQRVQEYLAKKSFDELKEGRHEVEVESEDLRRFEGKISYTVERVNEDVKKITTIVSFNYGGKQRLIKTKNIKVKLNEIGSSPVLGDVLKFL
jgi:prepilin-type N-terminal cleavage/methylation domain-containing protein